MITYYTYFASVHFLIVSFEYSLLYKLDKNSISHIVLYRRIWFSMEMILREKEISLD